MRSNLQKYGIIILAILGFVACSRVPKGVLSEKEMQKVLADMLVAEAMTTTNYNDYREDSTKVALYESVFRKHKITREVYDSSLVWYGQNLDIYMKVYDRVVADYSKQIASLGDVQAEAGPTTKRDSVDIWPRRTLLTLQPNSVFNGVVFDIKPDAEYASGSSFVLGMHVWGLEDELKYKPEIRLTAEHRDTTITVSTQITEDGYHEAVLRTMPTRKVRRVYGYIRMDNSDTTYYKVYVDSLNLVRYNYGTEIPGHP